MAVIKLIGFETGDLSEVTASAGVAVSTTARSGGYSMTLPASTSSAGATIPFGATLTTFGVRFAVKGVGTSGTLYAAVRQSSTATSAAWVNLDVSALKLRVQWTGGGSVTTAADPYDGNWHEFRLLYTPTTFTAIVDGVTHGPYSITGISVDQMLILDGTTMPVHAQCWIDDICIDNSAMPPSGKIIARQGKGASTSPTYNTFTKTNSMTADAAWSNTPFSATTSATATAAGAQTMLLASFSQPGNISWVAPPTGGGTSGNPAYGATGTNEAVAQAYTPSSNLSVSGVVLSLYPGSATDNIIITLRQASPTGTSLASVTVAASTINQGLNYFVFPSAVSLASGTKYYVVMSRSGSRSTVNFIIWHNTTGTGGTTSSSGSWAADSGSSAQALGLITNADCIALTDTLNSIKVAVVGKRGGGGGRTHTLRLRYDGTDYDSPDWTAISTSDAYRDVFPSPNQVNGLVAITAPDSAWNIAAPDIYAAQTFSVSVSGVVKAVSLHLGKNASPSAPLLVEIATSLLGTAIASGTVAAASISGFVTSVTTCTLTTTALLNTGTTYYIRVSSSGVDATNCYRLGTSSTNPYAGGTYHFYSTATGDVEYTGYDAYLVINYGALVPSVLNSAEAGVVQGSGTLAQAWTVEDVWVMADYTPTTSTSGGTYTGSGLVQSGGTATRARTWARTSSGGAQSGGTAARTRTWTRTGSGLVQSGGTATLSRTKAFAGSGTAQTAGAGVTLPRYASPIPSPYQFETWTLTDVTITTGYTDPQGGVQARQISATAADSEVKETVTGLDPAAEYRFAVTLRADSAASVTLRARYGAGGTDYVEQTFALTTSWAEYEVAVTPVNGYLETSILIEGGA